MTALATTAVFHPKLTPLQRLENALTAFILLDLCELAAFERSQTTGEGKTRVWLAEITQNLQEPCGAVLEQLVGHLCSRVSKTSDKCSLPLMVDSSTLQKWH